MAASTAAAPAFRGLLIDCEEADKWKGLDRLYLDRLEQPGDDWSVACVPKGEPLPDPAGLDAVVLTGSHHSAYDNDDWILNLVDWLRSLMSLPEDGDGTAPAPRVFGVCFGHQIVARAVGSDVGRNHGGAFWFRNATLQPTPVLAELPWTQGMWVDEESGKTRSLRCGGFETSVGPLRSEFADEAHKDISLRPSTIAHGDAPGSTATPEPESSSSRRMGPMRLMKSHGDAVLTAPKGALVLASSPGVDFEMLLLPPMASSTTRAQPPEAEDGPVPSRPWKTYRALTVQGHPEFTGREMQSKILPPLRERMGETEAAVFEATKDLPCHDWAVLEIAQRFLRRQDESAPRR